MSADTWIGIVVGSFVTLVVGYIVVWTSGPIAQKFRKWRDDRAQKKAMESVKNAKKRIESLERDFKTISLYIHFPVVLSAVAFKSYAMMAFYFANALLIGFGYFITYGANPISNKSIIIQDLNALFVLLFLIIIELSMLKMVALMDKIAYISTYEKKISKQIADLQEVIKKFENAGITSNPGI